MTISKIIGTTDPALNIGTHTYFLSTTPGEVEVVSAVNSIEEIPEAAIFVKVNPDWPVLILKIVGIPSMMRLLLAESNLNTTSYEKFGDYQDIEMYVVNNGYTYMTINTLVAIPPELGLHENFTGQYQRVCCSLFLTKEQRASVFQTIGQRVARITDKYVSKPNKVPVKVNSIQ